MNHELAMVVLDRLHQAQNAFYAGGDEGPARCSSAMAITSLCSPMAVGVIAGEEHTWSTVGLYRVRNDLIAQCWLLPLDPVEFDRIWQAEARPRRPATNNGEFGP